MIMNGYYDLILIMFYLVNFNGLDVDIVGVCDLLGWVLGLMLYLEWFIDWV